MTLQISAITMVVPNYDDAIAFYVGALGFSLEEDTQLSPTKRWVRVAPTSGGTALLLAVADDEQQASAIGNQTGGRVSFFLQTDNFARSHEKFLANGVKFLEQPRHEIYGTVAVFQDPSGNKWDLIEMNNPS